MERSPGIISVCYTTTVTPGHAADALEKEFHFEAALLYDTRNVPREPVDVAVSRQRDRP